MEDDSEQFYDGYEDLETTGAAADNDNDNDADDMDDSGNVVDVDSVDAGVESDAAIPQRSHKNGSNKMKLLVRSHALREAASPPPDASLAAAQHGASLESIDAASGTI